MPSLGGVILNLRFDLSVFKNGDMRRLADLTRTFVDQKIYHLKSMSFRLKR